MTRSIALFALGALSIAHVAVAQTPTPQTAPKPPVTQSLFAAQPTTPFPEGARIGFVSFQVIAEKSALGQAATARLTKLQNVKFAELDTKAKALKALQDQSAAAGATTTSESARLRKEIERAQIDIQYSRQMVQKEMDDLTDDAMADFTAKVRPIVEEVRAEKSLWAVFVLSENFVALVPGLDLSMEVVRRLEAKK